MSTHHLGGPPTPEEFERVVKYLQHAHKERGLTEFELSIATQFAKTRHLTRKQVDAILKRADAPTLPGPDVVPAGYYALPTPDGETFYVKVWRGSRDPSYVKVYAVPTGLDEVGDDGAELPTGELLRKIIQVGPASAALSFGRLTDKCSICARRLDNALSRKLCIGPVCGGRFYDEELWPIIKLEATVWLAKHGINPRDPLPANVNLRALEAAEVAS